MAKAVSRKGGLMANAPSDKLLQALLDDWVLHGKEAIERFATENPIAFIQIVASLGVSDGETET
jgi:hypothetical protein